MAHRIHIRFAAFVTFTITTIAFGVYPTRLLAQPVNASASNSNPELSQEKKGLLLAPKAFRAAAERIRPSLVVIESFGGSTVASGQMSGLRGQGEGNTTGVILSSDGWIVTSTFNFIQQPPVVTVITQDGERHVARLAGRDDTRNLCLLKIQEVDGLAVPSFASEDSVQVGQWAVSVGVGYGDETPALSAGVISAVGRASGRAIQTDANLSPANYGGPLLNIKGELLGICVPLNPTSPGPAAGVEWYDSGIGFAIPIQPDVPWLQRLKDGERLQFGFLGINANVDGDNVVIENVQEESPAARAGLQNGDRIKSLNDVKISDTTQMGVELRRYLAGETVVLAIEREEESLEIEVQLESTPTAEPEIPPIQLTPVEPEGDDR